MIPAWRACRLDERPRLAALEGLGMVQGARGPGPGYGCWAIDRYSSHVAVPPYAPYEPQRVQK